jgi:hypothetical protein
VFFATAFWGPFSGGEQEKKRLRARGLQNKKPGLGSPGSAY